MRFSYVIDNRNHRMADVLNIIMAEHGGCSLDIATAYFTVGGFGLVKEGMTGLSSFRLLLGTEPSTAEQLGIRSAESVVKGLITKDLEELPFDEETLLLVEDLIAFLGRDNVAVRLYDKGFLHAKCYLFYADEPSAGWERLRPLVGIVGSSNFTVPGLTSNRELNLAHKTLLSENELTLELKDPSWVEGQAGIADETLFDIDMLRRTMSRVGARAMSELDAWFEEMWQESRDFKDELITLLDASKFGSKEYAPYQVYMKALYEYFKDDLEKEELGPVRSAVELAEFQEDAVKKLAKSSPGTME